MSDQSMRRREVSLEVHPSVVFKLGEDLITDDGQAIAELAKNSYDADATFARVDVDTLTWFYRDDLTPSSAEDVDRWLEYLKAEAEGSSSPEPARLLVRGQITVTDDGTGMTFEAIRDGWLTVSSSAKRRMKAAGKKTDLQRTPLGDKGLGRLGVQRLGQIVHLDSVPRRRWEVEKKRWLGDVQLRTVIDWERFVSATKLSAVPVDVDEREIGSRPAGSTVRIVGLRNPGFWTDVTPADLDRELITLVSPYDTANGFRLVLRVNKEPIDVRERARTILDSAPIAYDLTYAAGTLSVRGRMAASELRGVTKDSVAFHARTIAPDNGHAFAAWLLTKYAGRAREVGLQPGDDRHFLKFDMARAFADARAAQAREVDWADPGDFTGAVSTVDLRGDAEIGFSSNAARKEFAKALRGIKVYRNGFGIRLADDWLNLAKRWTEGSSYYTLRPDNTLGFINLSVEENAGLEETTSREQFRDTPAWRGFYGLLSAWADWTERVQSFIRRSYNEFRRELEAEQAELPRAADPAEMVAVLSTRITSARNVISRVESNRAASKQLDSAVKSLVQQRDLAANQVFADPAIASGIDEALKQIASANEASSRLLDELRPLVGEYEELQTGVRLLESQIDVAREQIAQAWESVAAGLAAETLSHEVSQISDRLIARSSQIKQHLRSQDPADARALAFAEYVRSASVELTRHVARLNPALRYRRERRETFQVATELEELLEYHRPRLARESIDAALSVERDFSLTMNRGKFTQIFDNLVLNSEFWVRAAQRQNAHTGTISLTVRSPVVLISDSGPGVDPTVQESLFEPFVTMKPREQGRGLGLFVVRQLLESENGNIELAGDLNAAGRRHIFRVEFDTSARSD